MSSDGVPHFFRKSAGSGKEVEAILSTDFGKARFEIDPEGGRSGAHARTTCTFDSIRIDRTECVGGTFAAEPRALHIDVTVRGQMSVTSARCEVATSAQPMVSWAAANEPITVLTKPGTLIFSLRVMPEDLMRAGLAMHGPSFSIPSRPTGAQHRGMGAVLARNLGRMFYELGEVERAGLSALVVPPFKDMLYGLALAVVRPDLLSVDGAAENERPWIVARAEEVLHERALEPISITEVAAEVGVTVRALQLAFRRRRGCSPLQYLMKRRMELARLRMLNPMINAKPRATVQSIIMECGIANAGSFAARYKAVYGELPSETLARGRR